MNVSIFNDVIGPVMRGPSSSHCAGPLRIGRLARDVMGGDFNRILVEFDRRGSLPTTHESQGADMGLFAGLMGWDAIDERLPRSAELLRAAGIQASIGLVDADDKHPNTFRLTLMSDAQRHFIRAVSSGGGMIELINIDEFPLSICGDYHETLIWVKSDAGLLVESLAQLVGVDSVLLHKGVGMHLVEVQGSRFVGEMELAPFWRSGLVGEVRRLRPVLPVASRKGGSVPFTTCAEMLTYDAGRGRPLWKLGVDYEMARGNLTEQEVMNRMVEIVRILRHSIAQGLAGTHYEDRILGCQSGRFNVQMNAGRLLDGGALNRIILYTSAIMEVKSAMGVIVAAPTAGACAALPAAVIAMAEGMRLSEEAMATAMLAAGIVGVFIATQWTFAAEVGGCQAEGGSAAAMAAAALVSLGGGTLQQTLASASMALQSMLGLICDPIAGRVEAPCLGKNVMAAANALCCANMALADYDPLIPFDEVIEAAKQVAGQMPRELRCTALGGLAIAPTSLKWEHALAARNRASCRDSCSCSA